jgi:hypothetical protein
VFALSADPDAKTRFLVPWHPAVAATNNLTADLLLTRNSPSALRLAGPCARWVVLLFGDPAAECATSNNLQQRAQPGAKWSPASYQLAVLSTNKASLGCFGYNGLFINSIWHCLGFVLCCALALTSSTAQVPGASASRCTPQAPIPSEHRAQSSEQRAAGGSCSCS